MQTICKIYILFYVPASSSHILTSDWLTAHWLRPALLGLHLSEGRYGCALPHRRYGGTRARNSGYAPMTSCAVGEVDSCQFHGTAASLQAANQLRATQRNFFFCVTRSRELLNYLAAAGERQHRRVGKKPLTRLTRSRLPF